MKSLQIKELPLELYVKLKRLASEQRRSLAQQAVVAIAKGLESELDSRSRRERILARISAKDYHSSGQQFPSAVDLIREDRER